MRTCAGRSVRVSAIFWRCAATSVFAGLIYTLIGIAAAVMTTNGPLMPFFFPVVAGVGLLGPVAAVGFYELARRREDGLESDWSHFLDVRNRPAVDDMGIVAGLLLAIFAPGSSPPACSMCPFRLGDADIDRRLPRNGIHHARAAGR